MRPKVICLLILVLGVVGCVSAVAENAEEFLDTKEATTPASEFKVSGDELSPGKKMEGAIPAAEVAASEVAASEVADMMRDPYRPYAVDSDDDKEETVDSGIVSVNDSHVVKANKTHESDSMPTPPDHQDLVADPTSTASSPTSPDSPAGLPEVPVVRQEPGNSTAASGELGSGSNGVGATSEQTSDVDVVDNGSPVISRLSSVAIVTGRSAMSPPTEVAAILSVVLVVSAVAGYLGMLAWRRILEKRYGNREMLVNEDDDLRHFEL